MSTIPVLANPLTEDHIESLLEQVNVQIYEMARCKVPRAVIPSDVLDLEIDELAQRIRIKLWQALRSGRVHNLKAYLRCIVATECVDMVRRHKKTLPLLFSEDGEIYQGNLMITEGQEARDPAEEFEQRENLANYVRQIADDLQSLSFLQRKAMLCALKERIADTLPLIEAFTNLGIDLEKAHWSTEPKQLKSLRSSLSIARKKLRARHQDTQEG